MRTNLTPRSAKWLIAIGLVLGAAAASAANGSTVTPEKESLIKVGMSADAVQQALGAPASVVTLRHEPGPTWNYDVAASYNHAIFEIDFDATGKVAWVDERQLPVE